MNDKVIHPVARVLLIAGGFLIAAIVWGTAVASWLNAAPIGMPSSTVVTVRRGDTLKMVATGLERRKLIRSAQFLEVMGILSGRARQLKAGRYRVDRGATALDIQNILVTGRQILARVTIPDGWTLKQTADRLQALHIVSRAAFLAATQSRPLLRALGIPGDSAAGFLFPDTYEFPEHYPAEKVVRAMAQDFFRRVASIYPDFRSLSGTQLLDKVTLASIVEGEYRIPREAPVIASVFYNRLKEGMRLQSCATVSYVLTDIEGLPHQTRLYDKDLKVRSPYNTYLHWGLPPGPIDEPGSVALHAVFYPAKTDYLYFVLENPRTGEHFFSRTFRAHLMATYRLMNLYLKQS